MKRIIPIALAASIALAAGAIYALDDTHSHSAASTAASPAAKPDSAAYPIDYCIVSGEKLGEMGDPVKYDYKGRTVLFCCKGCIKKFEAEPAKYIAALDAATASVAAGKTKTTEVVETAKSTKIAADTTGSKATPKLTTLDWCIVSGEKLGEMGKPVPYKYKDREMAFCCNGCIKAFDKSPQVYVARLDSALAGQIKQPVKEKPVEEKKEGHSGHQHGGAH